MGALEVNSEGFLRLPKSVATALKGGALELVSASSEHLFLSRPDKDAAVQMAGLIVEGCVPDLLSFFNMFRRTGVLTFDLKGGAKSLYFQQGEIVYATSTFANEDLGEVLFSLGKLERKLLKHARAAVRPNTTLAKVLVDLGAATPKDLWMATRVQVESIVYSLFGVDSGGFSFQLLAIEQEQILRLSMSTQNLIMEGLRRQDERALFMRKIISLDYYPKPTARESNDLLDLEGKLLHLARPGNLSAKELFRKAGCHEFEGLRHLHELVSKRLLAMEETPTTAVEGPLGEIFGVYNNLFKALFLKLGEKGADAVEELNSNLRDLPQPYSYVLCDVQFQRDGAVDGQKVVANLNGLAEGDRRKLLADSLCEATYMITMLLRREMSAEEARPLIAKVQDVTTKVRHMVGRM